MRQIEIYDTTLRDGSQMRDISFSVADKLKVLKVLDDLGVHFIEGGWPGANPKDIDFFEEAKKLNLKNSKLVAFGSTRKANTTIESDPILAALLRADTKYITIVAKSSAHQIETTMRATPEENLSMLTESIEYLKSKDREVFVDAEHFFDGYQSNPGYSKDFVKTAIKAGADRMILCDTNGGSLPEFVFNITDELVKEFGSEIQFGIHAHNDGELAVANSIRAIRAGAVQVQGTINGYGERCGNANLVSIIPNLQLKYKADQLMCVPEEKLEKLTTAAKTIAEIANMNMNPSQAFVGERAFTHKGGLHVSAVQKDKTSYEHIEPSLVGNKTRIVVSEQSGISNVVDWLNTNNFKFLSEDAMKTSAQKILAKTKELENEGYSFENAGASFELLLRTILDETAAKIEEAPNLKETGSIAPKYFELIENNVHIVNGEQTEATVRIKVAAKDYHSASLGNGPANALDMALRKALSEHYPALSNFQLLDFKVRIIDSHLGTGAVTKVQVTTGDINKSRTWDTLGVSGNIVKASWLAIVDSVEYGLMSQGIKPIEGEAQSSIEA